jgi:hypothetical protein
VSPSDSTPAPSPLATATELVVYARAYCHLCDEMLSALAGLAPRLRFTVAVIDIDADPALEARYGEWVPVLAKDGAEICHHFLDRARLEAALSS